jgi:hypothetical protein
VPFRIPEHARKSTLCPACRKDVEIEDVPIDSDVAEARGRRKKKSYLYEDEEDDRPKRRPKRRRVRKLRPDRTVSDLMSIGRVLLALLFLGIGAITLLLIVVLVFAEHSHFIVGTPFGLILGGIGFRMLFRRE